MSNGAKRGVTMAVVAAPLLVWLGAVLLSSLSPQIMLIYAVIALFLLVTTWIMTGVLLRS
ncbi:MAG: hypothetical protein K8E66_04250 [Phycisphaerales bacterium]|nr:hypothetical protein [Phycisphaerales bacterium]